MFLKKFGLFLISLFVFASPQTVFGQTENVKSKKIIFKIDETQFYQKQMLKEDYKEADAVLYVDIKERKLIDSIGSGECESDKGTGYCLYLLKADVKEVFKGNIVEKTVEFYTSPDTSYPKKYLMGERVVFLNWNNNSPNRNDNSMNTMENSTRWIKYDVLKKIRKIAKKK